MQSNPQWTRQSILASITSRTTAQESVQRLSILIKLHRGWGRTDIFNEDLHATPTWGECIVKRTAMQRNHTEIRALEIAPLPNRFDAFSASGSLPSRSPSVYAANPMPLLSHIIGLVLCIVWVFSLWLLLAGRRWFPSRKPLRPLALLGGMLLFFVLSLTGMVYLQLLFPS